MVELHTRNEPPSIFLGDNQRWSNDFKDFLSRRLERDPKIRPGVKELLNHTFIENQVSRSDKEKSRKMSDFFTALPSTNDDLNDIVNAITSSIGQEYTELSNHQDESKLENLLSQLNMSIDTLRGLLFDDAK